MSFTGAMDPETSLENQRLFGLSHDGIDKVIYLTLVVQNIYLICTY